MSQTAKDGRGRAEPTDMMTWAILFAFACAVAYGLWYFARYQVIVTFLGPAWLELNLFQMVSLDEPTTNKWLAWINAIYSQGIQADKVTLDDIANCYTRISYLTFDFYTVLFFILAVWLLIKPKTNFERDFSLGGYRYGDIAVWRGRQLPNWLGKWLMGLARLSGQPAYQRGFRNKIIRLFGLTVGKGRIYGGINFIAYQSQAWPQIACVEDFDPTDCIVALTDGLRPEYWAAFKGIISREDASKIMYRLPNQEMGPIAWNRQKARNAFAGQVAEGGEWQGFLKAPIHVQALCLIAQANREILNPLVIKIAGECSSAAKGLFRLRQDATPAQIKAQREIALTSLRKIVAAYVTPAAITEINNLAVGHRYVRTATIAIVAKCGPNSSWGGGSFGALQSSLFLWLKPIDRTLFFCCQAIGAKSYPVEAAGAIAHFQAEMHAVAIKARPPQIWVEGPVRWLEGLFERGENGPKDADTSSFDEIDETGMEMDY